MNPLACLAGHQAALCFPGPQSVHLSLYPWLLPTATCSNPYQYLAILFIYYDMFILFESVQLFSNEKTHQGRLSGFRVQGPGDTSPWSPLSSEKP